MSQLKLPHPPAASAARRTGRPLLLVMAMLTIAASFAIGPAPASASTVTAITTIAGDGTAANTGDGGPASSASVNAPESLATDAAGNTYLASGDRVRRIDALGTITTIAGGGATPAATGVPATSAALGTVDHVTTAPDGTVFFSASPLVFRLEPSGLLTEVTIPATNGVPVTTCALYGGGYGACVIGGIAAGGPNDLSIAWGLWDGITAGTFYYVGSWDGGKTTIWTPNSIYPTSVAGLARWNGAVIISDGWGSLLRETPTTESTIAGTGTPGFSGDGGPASSAQLHYPAGMHASTDGLYVADEGNHRIRRIASNGTISTVAGNGTAGFSGDGSDPLLASLNNPRDVALDRDGRVLIADTDNNRVRDVGPAGPPSVGNGFHAVTPFRVLDSRIGTGFAGAVGAGSSKAVTVSPVGAVPAGATAVVMNVTVTGGSAASYLTAFPTGSPTPTAANLLFAPGQTVPNLVTVGVGTAGQVSFFNQLGSVDVIGDIVGYFDGGTGVASTATNNAATNTAAPNTAPSGDGFYGVTPTRILDSRGPTGSWNASLGANTTRDLVVAGVGPVPANASAVIMNVTVTAGTAASYLQAYPAGAVQPVTANVLFAAGQTVPNLVTVGIGTAGKVTFYNQLGSVHVIADVVGYYAPGGSLLHPIVPTRILDTRDPYAPIPGPITANTAPTLQVTGGIIPTGATGLVANITATGATNASYLAVNPTPGPLPAPTANLLFAAGQTIPNLTTVALPTTGPNTGQIDIYNQQGTVHIITDATAYYAPT